MIEKQYIHVLKTDGEDKRKIDIWTPLDGGKKWVGSMSKSGDEITESGTIPGEIRRNIVNMMNEP